MQEIWLRVWKGELLIWSFTLEAGIGRAGVGCCWLLLIADDCYWLLLVAASCCWMLDDCWLQLGYCWLLLTAAGGCYLLDDCWLRLGYCLLNDCWLLMDDCWRVFEYFQDIDDLRLRLFCRQKSLWIFPGYWRFAAKTILQSKKSFNISRILTICG